MYRNLIRSNAVLAFLAIGLLAPAAFAAGVVTVTQNHLRGWTVDSRAGGSGQFVTDASAPGGSALQLVTPNDNASAIEYDHSIGTALNDVTNVSYMTKTIEGPVYASASLALYVKDAAGATHYYVYEPYWQNGPTEIAHDVWQTWDVMAGTFWSSDAPGGPPAHSWASILADNPGGTLDSIGVFMGTYNPGWTVNVDSVTVNDTTWDFQKSSFAKEDCKKDGWKNLQDSSGRPFRNQGACMAAAG